MSTISPIASLETDLQALRLRLLALESEVALLKQNSTVPAESEKARRWERVGQKMKDDPEFAEILRLGREFRQSYFTE